MALYEMTADLIKDVPLAPFAEQGIGERRDLQRLLRGRIEVVDSDTLVIAEEFGDWEESRRRIDLLGIDRGANLVVIELKRTESGGHMELQALRYAALVSAMTFERGVLAYRAYLDARGEDPQQAEERMLNHLSWDEPNEEEFGNEVRVVLVAADFSRELTSTVLWLNDHDLDIRCVRIRPYALDGRTLLDVQTIIPLPEAIDYQEKQRERTERRRVERREQRDMRRFDLKVGTEVFPRLAKRHLIFTAVRKVIEKAGASPDDISKVITSKTGLWLVLEGTLNAQEFRRRAEEARRLSVRGGDPYRYFCDEGDLIHHSGKTYAFSNQWGTPTLPALDELSRHYPDLHLGYEESQ